MIKVNCLFICIFVQSLAVLNQFLDSMLGFEATSYLNRIFCLIPPYPTHFLSSKNYIFQSLLSLNKSVASSQLDVTFYVDSFSLLQFFPAQPQWHLACF